MKKHTFISFSLVFLFIWFTLLNLIYTAHEVKLAFEAPNVTVNLDEPLFGVSGIYEVDNDFEWKKIDSGFAFARSNGNVLLNKECQAYISFDKTILFDTESYDQHILSKDEMIVLFSEICDANNQSYNLEFEIEDLSKYFSKGKIWLPMEFVVSVSGKYTGEVFLENRHPQIPIEDTDFSSVWSDSVHFPYYAVFICLITSSLIVFLLSLVANYVFKKTNRYMFFLLVEVIPVIPVIIFAIFLWRSGYSCFL